MLARSRRNAPFNHDYVQDFERLCLRRAGVFATLGEIEFKMFGVTMAAAVLTDATIVRGVLLPAGLSLLGDRAWGRRESRTRARSAAASPDGFAWRGVATHQPVLPTGER